MNAKRTVLACLVLVCCSATASAQPAPFRIETVAFLGDPAPGVDPTAVYTGFGTNPSINNRGEVLFAANVHGLTAFGGGFFLKSAGGAFAFTQQVVRSGQSVPDGGGAEFTQFFGSALGHGSDVAFVAGLEGPAGRLGLGVYAGRADSLREVARAGDPAPGVPEKVFEGFKLGGPDVNRFGLTAFQADVARPDGSGNERPTYKETTEGLVLVARLLDPTPVGGVFLSQIGDPAINGGGLVAFVTGVSPSIPFEEVPSEGVFAEELTESSPRLRAVAAEGDLAPGGLFHRFDSFLSVRPGFNDVGRVAFFATARDPLTRDFIDGIYKEVTTLFPIPTVSRFHAVVVDGDPAPGTGFNFRMGTAINAAPPALNNPGRVAFLARLDDNPTGAGSQSIWIEQLDGSLQLVVRPGTVIEVHPGDLRVVKATTFALGFRGPSGFNDIGQVTFHAIFTDESEGIFRTVAPGMVPDFPLPFLFVVQGGPSGPRVSRRRFGIGTTGFGTERPLFVETQIGPSLAFSVRQGDPNFASLTIPAPTNTGDKFFFINFNGMSIPYQVGAPLDFRQVSPGGVDSFALTDIDFFTLPGPNQPPATLVSGLTFVSGGVDVDVTVKAVPLKKGGQ